MGKLRSEPEKKKKKGDYEVNLYGKYQPKNLGRRNRRHQDVQEAAQVGSGSAKRDLVDAEVSVKQQRALGPRRLEVCWAVSHKA